MALFLNPSKKAAREKAQQLVKGHLSLHVFWTLKHAGVFDELIADKLGVKVSEYARKNNMSDETLAALLDYAGHDGLVTFYNNVAKITPLGRALAADEDALLETLYAFDPVTHGLEHILARLKAATHKKPEAAMAARALKLSEGVYPALERALPRQGGRCCLDLACGGGELLIRLARKVTPFIGVGISESGSQIRQANTRITEVKLEKRLIAVTANMVEVCTDPKPAFERAGISAQTWQKFDAVLAVLAFSDLASEQPTHLAAALSGIHFAFPNATLYLVEPCAGAKFEKSPAYHEMNLLHRLTRTRLMPAREWEGILTAAGFGVSSPEALTEDGMTLFRCVAKG